MFVDSKVIEAQQQQQALANQETMMSLDGTDTGTTFGSSPASMQSGDGRWVAHAQHYMEPYSKQLPDTVLTLSRSSFFHL